MLTFAIPGLVVSTYAKLIRSFGTFAIKIVKNNNNVESNIKSFIAGMASFILSQSSIKAIHRKYWDLELGTSHWTNWICIMDSNKFRVKPFYDKPKVKLEMRSKGEKKRTDETMQSSEKTAMLIRASYSRKQTKCHKKNNLELVPITMQIGIILCLHIAKHWKEEKWILNIEHTYI